MRSLICCGLLLFSGCTLPAIVPPTPPTLAATSIELAPDFRLTALTGEIVALSELRGRYVLINFWATWCLPCRDEMPYLQHLADTYAGDLTVLAINMRERPATIQPYVDALGITLPILLQPDDATLLSYGVRALPLSFLVDDRGQLIYRQVGPLHPDQIERLLAKQLGSNE
ncbi:MAG: TlpA disulfide reductase family protein [Caldilineaceae bacterium]